MYSSISNYQQLEHTQNFCSRNSKYIKCAGNHQIGDCREMFSATSICTLCGKEGHLAYYKDQNLQEKNENTRTKTTKRQVIQRMQVKRSKPMYSENVTAEKESILLLCRLHCFPLSVDSTSRKTELYDCSQKSRSCTVSSTRESPHGAQGYRVVLITAPGLISAVQNLRASLLV